jgi:hypothetical protein
VVTPDSMNDDLPLRKVPSGYDSDKSTELTIMKPKIFDGFYFHISYQNPSNHRVLEEKIVKRGGTVSLTRMPNYIVLMHRSQPPSDRILSRILGNPMYDDRCIAHAIKLGSFDPFVMKMYKLE